MTMPDTTDDWMVYLERRFGPDVAVIALNEVGETHIDNGVPVYEYTGRRTFVIRINGGAHDMERALLRWQLNEREPIVMGRQR